MRVVDGFDWRRIRHSSFHGDIALGRFVKQVRLTEGFDLPAGIYQSTLVNCVVGADVLINDVKLLAPAVLRHRIILNFDAHADGQTTDTVLSKIISHVSSAAAAK